jgi:hypothetical protein
MQRAEQHESLLRRHDTLIWHAALHCLDDDDFEESVAIL